MLQASQHKHILFNIFDENSCNIVVSRTVTCRPLKGWVFMISTMNNSTTEHSTMKLVTSYHSESTNDISISFYEKDPKLVKIPLL